MSTWPAWLEPRYYEVRIGPQNLQLEPLVSGEALGWYRESAEVSFQLLASLAVELRTQIHQALLEEELSALGLLELLVVKCLHRRN